MAAGDSGKLAADDHITGQIQVIWRADSAQNGVASAEVTRLQAADTSLVPEWTHPIKGQLQRSKLRFDESKVSLSTLKSRLAALPGVVAVYPVYPIYATQTSNDTFFSSKWDLYSATDHDIDANMAWFTSEGSEDVTVAVIDTGIDLTHPDLVNNIVAGYDFVNNDANPSYDVAGSGNASHGTHVAGIIAATANNAVGVAGVAPRVKIMPLRVLDDSGNGNSLNAELAIEYAIDHGAKVINMSLSTGSFDSSFDLSLGLAWQAGVTVVAAGGNNNLGLTLTPPQDPSFNVLDCVSPVCNDVVNITGQPGCVGTCDYGNIVLGVASIDSSSVRYNGTGASDYNATVPDPSNDTMLPIDVAAPGVGIESTIIGGYGTKTGTSMAAPEVAGLAALLRSASPGLTVTEVRDRIRAMTDNIDALQSATDCGGATCAGKVGTGRINAAHTVNNDLLVRLSGATRYDTAIAASQAQFPEDHSASNVVVVSGEEFPDALSAAALAAKKTAPILLSHQGTINAATQAELSRVLNPANPAGTVYIIGGTAAISDAVKSQIEAIIGKTATRISGADRIATAIAVADVVAPASPYSIFIANGIDFPDGLSASAPSAKNIAPILLNGPDALDTDVSTYLTAHCADLSAIYIVGGTTAMGSDVGTAIDAVCPGISQRLSGTDRYGTSAAIAAQFYGGGSAPTDLTFATGQSFPDALVAGPLAAKNNAPLLLVKQSTVPSEITTYMSGVAATSNEGYILGGTTVVSDITRASINAAF